MKLTKKLKRSSSQETKQCSCGNNVKLNSKNLIGVTFRKDKTINWYNCKCGSTLVNIVRS